MNARISITTTQQLGTMYTHGISNRETVTHIKGSAGLSFGIHQPFGHETNGLLIAVNALVVFTSFRDLMGGGLGHHCVISERVCMYYYQADHDPVVCFLFTIEKQVSYK